MFLIHELNFVGVHFQCKYVNCAGRTRACQVRTPETKRERGDLSVLKSSAELLDEFLRVGLENADKCTSFGGCCQVFPVLADLEVGDFGLVRLNFDLFDDCVLLELEDFYTSALLVENYAVLVVHLIETTAEGSQAVVVIESVLLVESLESIKIEEDSFVFQNHKNIFEVHSEPQDDAFEFNFC